MLRNVAFAQRAGQDRMLRDQVGAMLAALPLPGDRAAHDSMPPGAGRSAARTVTH